jgi:hypothetical protein
MQIDERKPEDVLKPRFVDTYRSLHRDIWYRLVQTNTSITILEKIIAFPFHYFYSPTENVFWQMVYWNFLYTVIVLLHGLTGDNDKDALTLNRFKNLLIKEWIKEQEKTSLKARLQKCEFSQGKDYPPKGHSYAT